MPDPTRRAFLVTAGLGAAAVGLTSAVPPAAVAAPADTSTPSGAEAGQGVSGPVVAYVDDVASGQISLLVGDREVRCTDRELAARIAGAARGAPA